MRGCDEKRDGMCMHVIARARLVITSTHLPTHVIGGNL